MVTLNFSKLIKLINLFHSVNRESNIEESTVEEILKQIKIRENMIIGEQLKI